MDRFAQLFLAPKFELSCLEREIQAVDSENTNYSMDDTWRAAMLHKLTAACPHARMPARPHACAVRVIRVIRTRFESKHGPLTERLLRTIPSRALTSGPGRLCEEMRLSTMSWLAYEKRSPLRTFPTRLVPKVCGSFRSWQSSTSAACDAWPKLCVLKDSQCFGLKLAQVGSSWLKLAQGFHRFHNLPSGAAAPSTVRDLPWQEKLGLRVCQVPLKDFQCFAFLLICLFLFLTFGLLQSAYVLLCTYALVSFRALFPCLTLRLSLSPCHLTARAVCSD